MADEEGLAGLAVEAMRSRGGGVERDQAQHPGAYGLSRRPNRGHPLGGAVTLQTPNGPAEQPQARSAPHRSGAQQKFEGPRRGDSRHGRVAPHHRRTIRRGSRHAQVLGH